MRDSVVRRSDARRVPAIGSATGASVRTRSERITSPSPLEYVVRVVTVSHAGG